MVWVRKTEPVLFANWLGIRLLMYAAFRGKQRTVPCALLLHGTREGGTHLDMVAPSESVISSAAALSIEYD